MSNRLKLKRIIHRPDMKSQLKRKLKLVKRVTEKRVFYGPERQVKYTKRIKRITIKETREKHELKVLM